jgi:hypothetical protein
MTPSSRHKNLLIIWCMPRLLTQISFCVLGSRLYRVVQLMKFRIVLTGSETECYQIHPSYSLAQANKMLLLGVHNEQ